MRRTNRLVVIALVSFAAVGCVSVTPRCAAGEQLNEIDTLYFGAGEASLPVWESFLDEVVTPRFPDGLTVLTGSGQWRNDNKEIVRESSYVLVIAHAPSAEADRALQQIASIYDTRFHQDSVLRIRSWGCVSFLQR